MKTIITIAFLLCSIGVSAQTFKMPNDTSKFWKTQPDNGSGVLVRIYENKRDTTKADIQFIFSNDEYGEPWVKWAYGYVIKSNENNRVQYLDKNKKPFNYKVLISFEVNK